mmetsp:Transcript_62769/g.147676  ORF Transcript_62769/g.147676 Transcript_62769/m.147676 type:complete len:389 (-) Transcript_62769:1821-2987(-)
MEVDQIQQSWIPSEAAWLDARHAVVAAQNLKRRVCGHNDCVDARPVSALGPQHRPLLVRDVDARPPPQPRQFLLKLLQFPESARVLLRVQLEVDQGHSVLGPLPCVANPRRHALLHQLEHRLQDQELHLAPVQALNLPPRLLHVLFAHTPPKLRRRLRDASRQRVVVHDEAQAALVRVVRCCALFCTSNRPNQPSLDRMLWRSLRVLWSRVRGGGGQAAPECIPPSIASEGRVFALDHRQLVGVGLSEMADGGLAHDERLALASAPHVDCVSQVPGQDKHAEHVPWRVRQAELLDVLRLDAEERAPFGRQLGEREGCGEGSLLALLPQAQDLGAHAVAQLQGPLLRQVALPPQLHAQRLEQTRRTRWPSARRLRHQMEALSLQRVLEL